MTCICIDIDSQGAGLPNPQRRSLKATCRCHKNGGKGPVPNPVRSRNPSKNNEAFHVLMDKSLTNSETQGVHAAIGKDENEKASD